MSSRDIILNKLKTFHSNETLHYEINSTKYENLIEEFKVNAKLAGAVICQTQQEQNSALEILDEKGDYNIFASELGVAENGALWCSAIGKKREDLFLSNDVVIKISPEDIVPTMHEAYSKIDLHNNTFATFISGPSKTADIEQSLVLGAHGAMGLYIFLEN
jgi:L-lactate utilization protein LutC